MAVTLVVNSEGQKLVVNYLAQNLTHAFLAKVGGSADLDATLSNADIALASSDGSSRVKQLVRDTGSNVAYQTKNVLSDSNDSKITSFYTVYDTPVNRLILMNNANAVRATITFPAIPGGEGSVYVSKIQINIS